MRRRLIALLGAVSAVLVLAAAAGAAPAAKPVRVTLIGDSVSAALDYVPQARLILARGFDLNLQAAVCRRLVAPSCSYQGVTPPPALTAIRAFGRALGPIVVIDVGYNDGSTAYKEQIGEVMRGLVAAGVKRVIWVTLREVGGFTANYRAINSEIRSAQERWPQMLVADWNGYSSGRPWFGGEGLHLTVDGAIGLAHLLRPYLLQARRQLAAR